MRLVFSFFLLLLFVTACGRNDYGGRLPMVHTQWEEDPSGDVLRWFTYSGYQDAPPINLHDNQARIGDDFPVPRAMAAKMLALAYADPSTIYAWARYPCISFGDVAAGSWYFQYVNAVYTLGLMLGDGHNFRPTDMLSLFEAGLLMAAKNPDGPGLYVSEENRNLPISYAVWVDLYVQLLESMDAPTLVNTVNLVPLSHNRETETVNSTAGIFSSIGINMGIYLDREIKILHRDYEVVALLGQISGSPTLYNVLILEADNLGITVFVSGVTRQFVYSADAATLPEGTVIADIQLYGGRITAATPSDTVIRGTIQQVENNRIMLREWGSLPLRLHFAVYSAINGNLPRGPSDLIVGADMADFYMTDGAIGAAVITNIAAPDYIRVLIGTSNFAGLIHSRVSITATGAFTVDGREFAPGEVFTATEADFANADRVYIQTNSPEYRLQIIGLERNHQNPLYRGTMEIARAEGGFTIVNELPLEEYLYAVVPSEMPSYYGLMAAKVQAVTARTFAVHQFYENRFRAFGAHVDDSIISQVYNNIQENDISLEAVRATAGQVLTYNGEIILANFFSTSSGVTANFGEVWAQGADFPAFTPGHLTSALQLDISEIENRALRNATRDLSIEENAQAFFRATDLPAFERDLPWFRWQVRMTVDELTGGINASLPGRQQANPSMIHSLDASGASTGRELGSIGRLTALDVTRRGQGGNAMEMIITGTDGRLRVQTEFNIRSLLAPRSATVNRHNGTQVTGMSLLPSGFFVIEKETDASGNLLAVIFHGGGHGHGVGMSQNGAHALLTAGYSYREVLMHYYPGAKIARLR